MKTLRQSLALVCMAIALAMSAGDDVITSIRSEYNQAQATIKQNKSTKAKNDMVTTMRYDVPGKGAAVETLHFFFKVEQFGPVGEFVNYQLFFVTRQLSLGGHKSYEEYLYDSQTGQLVFSVKQERDSKGSLIEKRLYYRDGTIFSTEGGTLDLYEEELTYFLGQDYRHAFDNLIRNAKE